MLLPILSAMHSLPGYFERQKQRSDPLELFPLTYNDDKGLFIISGQEVSLEAFDPEADPHELGIEGKSIDIDDAPSHPVLLPEFGGLFVGPKTHEFIAANSQVFDEVVAVMGRAYTRMTGYGDISNRGAGGFMAGFQNKIPEIRLQVEGNCACLAPEDPSLSVFEEQFTMGFAEYALHNADTQMQRASLYAGMGHIARLATEQQ